MGILKFRVIEIPWENWLTVGIILALISIFFIPEFLIVANAFFLIALYYFIKNKVKKPNRQ